MTDTTETNEIEQDDIDTVVAAVMRVHAAYTSIDLQEREATTKALEEGLRRMAAGEDAAEMGLPWQVALRELGTAYGLIDEDEGETNEDGEVEMALFELRRKDGSGEDPPGIAYFIIDAYGDNLEDNLAEANELLAQCNPACEVDYAEDDEDVEDDVDALTSDEEE